MYSLEISASPTNIMIIAGISQVQQAGRSELTARTQKPQGAGKFVRTVTPADPLDCADFTGEFKRVIKDEVKQGAQPRAYSVLYFRSVDTTTVGSLIMHTHFLKDISTISNGCTLGILWNIS